MTTGFLDPGMVNELTISAERSRKEVEEYVLKALLKEQDKHYVLLPYNFKYVFACVLLFVVSCTSLTRGGLTFTSVTCLRRYHWILLVIMLDHSKIYVMDSMRKKKSEYNDLLQLQKRYTL